MYAGESRHAQWYVMATIPAWKVQILKRKQMQEEEERRKQTEREEQLSKIPPWKRDMLMKKEREETTSSKPVRARPSSATPQRTESADKWDKAMQKAAFQPRPSQPQPQQQQAESSPTPNTSAVRDAWKRAETTSTDAVPAWKRGLNKASSPNLATSHTHSTTPTPTASQTVETSRPSSESDSPKIPAWKRALQARQQAAAASKKPVPQQNTPSVEPAWKKKSQPNSAPITTTPNPPAPKQPEPVQTSQPEPVPAESSEKPKSSGNDSPKIPAWKKAMLERQRAGAAKNAESASSEDDKIPTWMKQLRQKKKQKEQPKEEQLVATAEVVEPPPPPQPTPVAKKAPEIVNASTKQDKSTKLVETEGVVNRPPVFHQSGNLATISEDDPAFQKLPAWKKALILRRKQDVEKRTKPPPEPEPAPPSPTEKLQKADMLLAAWSSTKLNSVQNNGPVKETKKESSAKSVPVWMKEVQLRKTKPGPSKQDTQTHPKRFSTDDEEDDLECTAIDEDEDTGEESTDGPMSILKRVPTPKKGVSNILCDHKYIYKLYFYSYAEFHLVNQRSFQSTSTQNMIIQIMKMSTKTCLVKVVD